MKTRIFNLIILDESGSMCSIEKQALSGVNETIQSICQAQKENENQEHYITFVTFNNDSRVLYDRTPASDVHEITSKEYSPNMCTALYDAMGFSLTELKKCVADNDKVLVTVVTDGMENASKEYDGEAVSKLVSDLKKKGWIFTYIGANHDVENFAHSIHITNTMCFETTVSDTCRMFDTERRCRRNLYSRVCDEDFDADKANETFFKE